MWIYICDILLDIDIFRHLALDQLAFDAVFSQKGFVIMKS